ncbi:MAG: dipeptidase [Oscillospiraceae bacterium]
MNISVFDAHCDTGSVALREGKDLCKNDLHIDFTRAAAFGRYAQVFAVYVRREFGSFEDMDYAKDQASSVLVPKADALLSFILSEIRRNAELVSLCRTPAEIRAANESGKIAALLSVEGAELLGCDIGTLRYAHERGVRIVNLCWNYDNALCGAANGVSGSGLTQKGREFVKTMQELGMAVDLSHASERTFWDVCEIAEKPPFASHSDAKTLCDNPRNLTDAQFLQLIRMGGAAGLNLYPLFLDENGDADIETLVRHAEHFLSLGGEKTLCLGGDWDGVDYLPHGLTGIESCGEIYEAMLRRNWKEDLVRDIFYNNLFAYLEKVL